jgi:hypothetical protein
LDVVVCLLLLFGEMTVLTRMGKHFVLRCKVGWWSWGGVGMDGCMHAHGLVSQSVPAIDHESNEAKILWVRRWE